DKLVQNRTAQAHKLGFRTFTDLGYIRRQRNCYGKNEVKVFRDQVKADIVPLVSKIKENQRERIGVDKLRFYDDGYCFKEGNANPHGTPDELLAAGKKMYTEMSPETAEFIDFMFEHDLFDVLAKDGKAPGGYCTTMPVYKSPFIFSNFNGTAGDVDVLTHEAGHAFAAYQAYKNTKWLKNADGSMDCCETHSMSMEFLTMPWHELFFKEDTARYELSHMEDSINFLPYGCMVDNFQEICYENPSMTKQERNDAWLKLEHEYRPYIDFDNLPFYSRGGGYQRQLHIYLYPFYYVDYCMSGSIALQFFTLSQKNRADAWKKYLAFVNTAGLKTFVDAVKSAGLISPLEPGSLREISKGLTQWLDENKA
ncbi:MAG: M3 family oligoendopeptidase, partial [Angelakisella sp.]